ncbi:hypothetical protein MMPV_006075 [Pyropia vietnamensis]
MGKPGLYAAYRSLGLVADGGVAAVHQRGPASFITAAVDGGRAVHLYDVERLALKGASPYFPSAWGPPTPPPPRATPAEGTATISGPPPPPPPPPPVRANLLATVDDLTYVVTGARIGLLRRLKPVGVWDAHDAPITAILPLGVGLVATASAADGRVVVWASPAGEVVADVALPPGWMPTALAHPPTYLNKLLVGGADGRLGLLNVRTGRLVHTFRCLQDVPGVDDIPMTVITPSAVLDVVAVGTGSGVVALLNVRTDEVITVFRHGCSFPGARGTSTADASGEGDGHVGGDSGKATGPAITGLSFRTDGMDTLLSASADGSLATWYLPSHSLSHVLRHVHPGGVATAVFLPGEATAVTVGAADNAVKVHVADDAPPPPSAVVPSGRRSGVASGGRSGGADAAAASAGAAAPLRLLRSRSGSAVPPVFVRFLGEEDGRRVLVGGADGIIRQVSVVRDAANRVMSVAPSLTGAPELGSKAAKRRRLEAGVEVGAAAPPPPEANTPASLGVAGGVLPPVVDAAACTARLHVPKWASAVTAHAGRRDAITWHLGDGRSGRALMPPPTVVAAAPTLGAATAVAIAPDGGLALVGAASGHVHVYNLQSGRYLGALEGVPRLPSRRRDKAKELLLPAAAPAPSLLTPVTPAPAIGRVFVGAPPAHRGRVGALAVNALGDTAVSGGADGRLVFWELRSRLPARRDNKHSFDTPAGAEAAEAAALAEADDAAALAAGAPASDKAVAAAAARTAAATVALPAEVLRLAWAGPTDLLAVAAADGTVYVVDAATRVVARRLAAVRSRPPPRLTDVCWAGGGRRLITAAADGRLRSWDVPSGRLVDVLSTPGTGGVTSATVSPDGRWVASVGGGGVGVRLWVDRGRFTPADCVGSVVRARRARAVAAARRRRRAEKGGAGAGVTGGATSRAAAATSEGDVSASAPLAEEEEDDGSERDDDAYTLVVGGEVDAGSSADDGGGDSNADDDDDLDSGVDSEPEVTSGTGAAGLTTAPLAAGLVTLSTAATAQWTTLANLAAIKRRNAPVEPMKKPAAAPFFLPTRPGLTAAFDFSATANDEGGEDGTAEDIGEDGIAAAGGGARGGVRRDRVRLTKPPPVTGGEAGGKASGKASDAVAAGAAAWMEANSEWGRLLLAGRRDDAAALLRRSGPSAADVELRSVEGAPARAAAAAYFVDRLQRRVDWELTSAHLRVFLGAHGRALSRDVGGGEALAKMAEAHGAGWARVRGLFGSVLTLGGYFSGQHV